MSFEEARKVFSDWFISVPWLSWLAAPAVCAVAITGIVKLLPWSKLSLALKTSQTLEQKVWVWVFTSLLSWIVVMAVFSLVSSLRPKEPPDAAMVFSIFWAVAVATLIFIVIPFLPNTDHVYAYLSGIAGGVVGWMVGLYISPQGISEQQRFTTIGTKVTALVSGVAGISVKTLWDKLNVDHTHQTYTALFILSAAIGTAAIYNTRAYGNQVKISFPEDFADPKDKRKIIVKSGKQVKLDAAVIGVRDTSVIWSIFSPLGSTSIDPSGRFSSSTPGDYKVQAQSSVEARLVDILDIRVEP